MSAVMLFVLCGQTAAAALEDENFLKVNSLFVSPGERVTIDIEMNNTAVAYAFQTDVVLPEGIEVALDEDGFEMIEVGTERTNSKRHTIDCGFLSNGNLRIMCYSTKYLTFSGNSGCVTKITLDVADDVMPGVYELQLKNSEITVASENGPIAVLPAACNAVLVAGNIAADGKSIELAGEFEEEAVDVLNRKLSGLDELLAVDMKNVTACEGTLVTRNPNALIYTSQEIGIENEENVVVGDVCANLVITDGYPFEVRGEVGIENGCYERVLAAEKFGSVILPFNPDEATRNAYRFYTFEKSGENYLKFAEVTEPVAGVPYIYENATDVPADKFTAAECMLTSDVKESSVYDWTMCGTFEKMTINDAETLDHMYYLSQNKMMNASKSLTISPFRAYLKGPSFAGTFGSVGRALSIRIDRGDTTGIENLPVTETDEKVIYDLSGRRTAVCGKGIYIINGTKILKTNE